MTVWTVMRLAYLNEAPEVVFVAKSNGDALAAAEYDAMGLGFKERKFPLTWENFDEQRVSYEIKSFEL